MGSLKHIRFLEIRETLPTNEPCLQITWFRVSGSKKEKKTIPEAPPCVAEFPCVATQYPHPYRGILTSPLIGV